MINTRVVWWSEVTGTTRKLIIFLYRLSGQPLAIEKGCHRQRCLLWEERLCSLCMQKEVETKKHFLIQSDHYQNIRSEYFAKFEKNYNKFYGTIKWRQIKICSRRKFRPYHSSSWIWSSLSQAQRDSQSTNLRSVKFSHFQVFEWVYKCLTLPWYDCFFCYIYIIRVDSWFICLFIYVHRIYSFISLPIYLL